MADTMWHLSACSVRTAQVQHPRALCDIPAPPDDFQPHESDTLFNPPFQTLGALICHSRLYLVHVNGGDFAIKS